jgi:hypothetical protein
MTPIATNLIAADAFLEQPEAAAIDSKNGNAIGPIPHEAFDRALVEITAKAAGTITLKGGLGPHGYQMPDVSHEVAQGDVVYLSPSRDHFRQPDGSIGLAYSAGMTGTVRVLLLPDPCPSF